MHFWDFRLLNSLTRFIASARLAPYPAYAKSPGKVVFRSLASISYVLKRSCFFIETMLILINIVKSYCSNFKYGRTVHAAMKDNPKLFNLPASDSDIRKLEYHAGISAERSNNRGKLDFKPEDGWHCSTKMWYCRLYHILMLQHLNIRTASGVVAIVFSL